MQWYDASFGLAWLQQQLCMKIPPLFSLHCLSRWARLVACACLLLGQAAVAQTDQINHPRNQPEPYALDLYAVWQLAFTHDANYKAAISQFGASQAQKNISRAGLLPQISGSYSDRRVKGWRERPGFFGVVQRSDLRYDSTNLHVQLRQPLLNYPRWAEYQRGIAVAEQGHAQLAIAQQKNSLQVAQNYFNVLLARVDLDEQQQRVHDLEQRVTAFERLRLKDNATEVDLVETQARLAIAQAEWLRAQDQLRTAARQLQAQIGIRPEWIKQLDDRVTATPLTADLGQLQDQARQHNREIQAAKQQVAIAKARLENARSQYFPALDLVATAGKGDSEDLTTLSQRTNTFTIGLQLQIPLFAGGYTTAITTQGRYQLQQAEHLYQRALGQVDTEVARLYHQYQSGIEQVAAQKQAMKSSQISLDSVEKSFSVGAASNLDVLDAKDQLSETRYEYHKAQLTVLQSRLELAAMVGDALHQPVQQMSEQFFGTSPAFMLDAI